MFSSLIDQNDKIVPNSLQKCLAIERANRILHECTSNMRLHTDLPMVLGIWHAQPISSIVDQCITRIQVQKKSE